MANTSPQALTVALLLLLCTFTIESIQTPAVTCPEIFSTISGCIGFACGFEPAPPPDCCAGFSRLKSEYKSTPDRRQSCSCIRTIFYSLPMAKPDRIAALPDKCGVTLGYSIIPSFNCSMVL